MRISTAEQVYRTGGTYTYETSPDPCFVFHYTVAPLPQKGKAKQMAESFKYSPQFWVDVEHRELVQCFDTLESGLALKNLSGGVQTNREPLTIQVEVLGNEQTIEKWVDEDLKWLADNLMKPLIAAHNIPATFIPQLYTSSAVNVAAGLAEPGANMASTMSPARMSHGVWSGGNRPGWVGHQNVPENSHTDGLLPGQLERLIELAYETEQDWFDMATEQELRQIVREEIAVATGGVNVRLVELKNLLVWSLRGRLPDADEASRQQLGLPDPAQVLRWNLHRKLEGFGERVTTIFGFGVKEDIWPAEGLDVDGSPVEE